MVVEIIPLFIACQIHHNLRFFSYFAFELKFSDFPSLKMDRQDPKRVAYERRKKGPCPEDRRRKKDSCPEVTSDDIERNNADKRLGSKLPNNVM